MINRTNMNKVNKFILFSHSFKRCQRVFKSIIWIYCHQIGNTTITANTNVVKNHTNNNSKTYSSILISIDNATAKLNSMKVATASSEIVFDIVLMFMYNLYMVGQCVTISYQG